MAVCKNKYPSAEEVGAGRSVNCWLYKEKSEEEAVSVSNE
jgi:hypothetical protein